MAPTLNTLPAELKLEILEKLPAKQIQQLRQVCKRARIFVDDNTDTITATICARERQRIVDSTQTYIFYDDDLHPLEKLKRWLHLRGIWTDYHDNLASLWLFVSHAWWIKRNSETPIHPSIPWTMELANALCAIHLQYHTTSAALGTIEKREFVNKFALDNYLFQDLSARTIEGALGQLYDQVANTPGGYFDTEIKSGRWDHWIPHGLLTSLVKMNSQEDDYTLEHGICSPAFITATFDLPELPITIEIFAYCVNSGSTVERVKAVFEARLELGPMLKAAMLEELHIV